MMSSVLRCIKSFTIVFFAVLITAGCFGSRDIDCRYAETVYGLPASSGILEFIGTHCSEHSETIAQFRVLHTLSQKLNEGDLLLFVDRKESSGPRRAMPCAPTRNLYYYEWAADENVFNDESLIYGDMPVPLWFLWSSRDEDNTQDLFDEDMFVRHYKDRVLKTVKGKE